MERKEVEKRVQQIARRVLNGYQIEESKEEVKWKLCTKTQYKDWAYKIAGMANAALGEPIIWVVGIRENPPGIQSIKNVNLASWEARIKACFEDGKAPAVKSQNIDYEGHTLVALVFDTRESPFVVKYQRGSFPEYIVPWYGTTGKTTATRSNLLDMLELRRQPIIERVKGVVHALRYANNRWKWGFEFEFFIDPKPISVTIPFDGCEVAFKLKELTITFPDIKLRKIEPAPGIEVSRSTISINGQGIIRLTAGIYEFNNEIEYDQFHGINGEFLARLQPYGLDEPLLLESTMEFGPEVVQEDTSVKYVWYYGDLDKKYLRSDSDSPGRPSMGGKRNWPGSSKRIAPKLKP